jgi:superfamily II DNA/RNA helicase
LGLSDEVMEAVKELGLTEPTEVQAVGIPAVLAGENVALASHTGSGKTLAYMLPIVQVLSSPWTECPMPFLHGTKSRLQLYLFCQCL